MNKTWWAVTTRPQKEDAAMTAIEAMGVECWMGREMTRPQGKRRKVTRPIWPRLIFVNVTGAEFLAVVGLREIGRGHHMMLGRETEGARGENIRQLKSFMAYHDAKLESDRRQERLTGYVCPFTKGDPIEVIGGLFEGRMGKFMEMSKAKARIDLGISGPVDVDPDLLRGRKWSLIS